MRRKQFPHLDYDIDRLPHPGLDIPPSNSYPLCFTLTMAFATSWDGRYGGMAVIPRSVRDELLFLANALDPDSR